MNFDPNKPQGYFFQKALSEVDDAVLGREVKKLIKRFVDPRGNLAAHIILACRVLIACCAKFTDQAGGKLEQEMKNEFLEGNPIGDYRITVERIKNSEVKK